MLYTPYAVHVDIGSGPKKARKVWCSIAILQAALCKENHLAESVRLTCTFSFPKVNRHYDIVY